MATDLIFLGDCVPYGIRTGVTASQTFAHLIAQDCQATYLNWAYYYGTVGRRPHTGGDPVNQPLSAYNPNTGLFNNGIDHLPAAFSENPRAIIEMFGEASIYRIGGQNGTPAESMAQFEANLITMAQMCQNAGVPLVLMTIVPQVLVEPASNEMYYHTDVLLYNEVKHKVAKQFGLWVIDAHEHLSSLMRRITDGGSSLFDPTGDPQNPNHHHNHLQPPGHEAVRQLLNRTQYARLKQMLTAPEPPPSGEWQSVFSNTLPNDSGVWNNYTLRVMSPEIGQAFTEVEVEIAAGASEGLNLSDLFVGVLGGNAIRAQCNGQNGAVTAAGQTAKFTALVTGISESKLIVQSYGSNASDTYAANSNMATGWTASYLQGNHANNFGASFNASTTASIIGVKTVRVR